MADVRQSIIEHATHLFARNGFDGTSIQAVAVAVGIKRPSLLYHFGSKDELREAVIMQVLGHWKDELPNLMAAATSGEDRLQAGLKAIIDFFRADPNRARLMVREMLDRPREMRALFIEHLRPWVSLVTDYIRQGQASGMVPSDLHPEAYIIQCVNMAVGTVASGELEAAMIADDGELDTDTLVQELTRLARTGLFVSIPHPLHHD